MTILLTDIEHVVRDLDESGRNRVYRAARAERNFRPLYDESTAKARAEWIIERLSRDDANRAVGLLESILWANVDNLDGGQ